MNVYVVRHAKAGSRRKWDGPDETRPLTAAGRRQADGIRDWLASSGATRVLSSPYTRCIQTLEPLARERGLTVEESESLTEGAPVLDALRLVEKVSDEPTVLCTHGDVLGSLVEHLGRTGVPVDGDGLEKGGTWVLDVEAGSITAARYVPPPG